MTDEIDQGGCAFPLHGIDGVIDYGMSLRDYFAGQAISSIPIRAWDDIGSGQALIEAWAKCAYAVADAMINARGPQDTRP